MPTSATPATWNEGGCRQVPRLPRETKVDVAKCHACHAKRRVPRLPRKMKVDVTKCHACQAKCRGVTGNQARPSTPPEPAQSQPSAVSAISATPATQNQGRCLQVPRLPRETKVDVAKCHACHEKKCVKDGVWQRYVCHACDAKPKWMSPSARLPCKWHAVRCLQVPHLPRK